MSNQIWCYLKFPLRWGGGGAPKKKKEFLRFDEIWRFRGWGVRKVNNQASKQADIHTDTILTR